MIIGNKFKNQAWPKRLALGRRKKAQIAAAAAAAAAGE